MKCYAVLLAHIAGFASINAFGTVQAKFFKATPFHSFFVVIPVMIFILAMQRITDTIRERVSLGDDGTQDEFEKLWDEETEEAENDVMGLSLSFLTINAWRYFWTGCLPNQEGKEEECPEKYGEDYLFHHPGWQKVALMSQGLFFAGLVFLIRLKYPESLEEKWCEENIEEVRKEHPTKSVEDKAARRKARMWLLVARACEGINVSIVMCFAWSFFYGNQMILAGSASIFEGETELLSVVLALVTSFLNLFLLFPLDALADAEWTDAKCDGAIRAICDAMALLIGFAWEQCFDNSVDAIAEKSNEWTGIEWMHSVTKLVLSIFCAALLVPAWKWYMLPFINAKGWKYGFVSDVPSLADTIVKMTCDDEGNPDPEKFEEAFKTFNSLAPEKHEALSQKKTGKSSKNLGEGYASAYQALAGDDVEALKKKNAELAAQLQKATEQSTKSQSDAQRAQTMLDNTMENLLASMKHMNDTVSRMEKDAGK